ncbi:hypothetical protein [Vibrio paucivorans]
MTYRGKPLQELTKEELDEYRALITNTISQLTREARSSSPTRSRDAHMRLPHWEEMEYELDKFLKSRR